MTIWNSISYARLLSSSVRFYPADVVLPMDTFLLRPHAVKVRPRGCGKKLINYLFIFYVLFIYFFSSTRIRKKINLYFILFYFIFPSVPRPHYVRADAEFFLIFLSFFNLNFFSCLHL
jgi:hypothetical protein